MEAPALEGSASSCDRCGDFAPLVAIRARRLCASCVTKRHPILAEPASARLYVAWSFKLIPAIGLPAGLMWAGLFVLNGLVGLAVQAGAGVSTTPSVASFLLTVLSLALYLVVYTLGAGFQTALAIQAIDGPVDWRAAARLTFGRFPSLLADTVLVSAAMFLGCMCCLVPGAIASMIWALPFPAILAHGAGPIDALSRSRRVMRGAWAPVGLALGMSLLAWFLWSAAFSLPATGYILLETLESGPAATAEAVRDPFFLAASLVANVFGGLGYLPPVNTAAIAYLNRTEGANSEK